MLNAALHTSQFWDGRAKDVEEQAGMPIMNPVEMAIPHKDFLVNRLASLPVYKEEFSKAFPEDKNPVTFENLQKSIAAFERTLITPSKFDKYLGGDLASLTAEEKMVCNLLWMQVVQPVITVLFLEERCFKNLAL